MKFSADLIFTGKGKPLRNWVVETTEKGLVVGLYENTNMQDVQYYPGIICPGFINSHIHLELSGARFENKSGLKGFLEEMKQWLEEDHQYPNYHEIRKQDENLFEQGIQFCFDISNTAKTINTKKSSLINYFTFLEIYESLSEDTEKKFEETLKLFDCFVQEGLLASVVPHSFYSVSDRMMNLFKAYNIENKSLTSIHFKEHLKENMLYDWKHEVYKSLNNNYLQKFGNKFQSTEQSAHLESLFDSDQRILLVHGIYLDRNDTEKILKQHKNSALCVCPTSNILLENRMTSRQTLELFSDRVFIGTDSQASNPEMNFLNEIFLFQENYDVKIFDVLKRVTSDPAKFFEMEKMGNIAPGNSPGLVLISSVDYHKEKITGLSSSQRLV